MAETEKDFVDIPDSLLDNNLEKDYIIKEYIAGRKKKEVCDELKKGYKEMAAVNLEWAETCLEADNECQLNYEEKLSECE
ncbi:MAG: CopG family transcriptional regulator [Clostridia bacterium]|nr:CopG family transcriptional regulator [Clostridia bacterium]